MLTKALCGDIGGTNANHCIADYSNGIRIEETGRKATSDYHDFTRLVQSCLKETDSTPDAACFAVAGPVRNQRVEMTNADLVIDAAEIEKNTDLEKVLVINDFDAVGYATNMLESSEILLLNKGSPEKEGVRAAIGAGTGLGKSLLYYDKSVDAYLPHSSEGGHTDFPMLFPEEASLFEHFSHPTQEDLLSGNGLETIYQALQKSNYPDEPKKLSAKVISEKRHTSPCARETFEWFVKFYARSAKNFAIDILATGGIFIAGGIAAANHDMFDAYFMKEFTRHNRPQFRKMLQNIPVTLIKNYGISLRGAALALKVHYLKGK